MKKRLIALAFMASATTSLSAQDTAPVQAEPVQAVQAIVPQQAPEHFLPANTEIMLSTNEEITTRRNEEGDRFNLSVMHNVMLGDYIVIPSGTRAVGEITWLTGRGMFGKSGKVDVELRYIDLNGRRIPIEGSYRQEGEGNTVATVAGVVLLPVAGLFITGRSGVIPEGRELTARLSQALPVRLPAGAVINTSNAVQAIPASAISNVTSTPEAEPDAPPQPVFPGAVVPEEAEGIDEE